MVPMTGSIICGVDSSESAKGAVRVARALGATLGRRLVLVRVVEPGSPEEEIDAIADKLRRMTESEPFAETEALWLVDVGHPADRLVAAATDEEASLVVLGSHGVRSSLLGSISADVSRRAPCPVVIVPPGADAVVTNGTGATRFADGIARFKLGVGGAHRLPSSEVSRDGVRRSRTSPAAARRHRLAAAVINPERDRVPSANP